MGQKAKKIVPKKIGNVKIPKRFRKTVNKALANPRTGEAVSAALLAVGTALAKKTLSQGATRYGFGAEEAKDQDKGPAKPAESAADIGALVAGAAGEAVRGVAGAVSRLVEEAVDTIRRDFGPGRDGGSGPARAADRDTEAGAQSEPVVAPEDGPGPRPAAASPADLDPAAKVGGNDMFESHDDNDDPFDGNDQRKPGPMNGIGP
ncbi:hypothetical protein [Rubellimicrobium roseum]|uniref:Uncharacterized protein n=1 Tax=Rubellimicrobium roseum TaxID=687525 RepID=A0A5C4N7L7_9RHOB|nr:hypothetical protein [Rubellimicrobium roseum]TNC68791.1 hypothetical protein FHG71_14295 [Rubellimicrobium roseum]